MFIEHQGVTNGRVYLVTIHNGHRNGYVEVKSSDNIDTNAIACHGGITFDGKMLGLTCIGFNSGHCGEPLIPPDELDAILAKSYLSEELQIIELDRARVQRSNTELHPVVGTVMSLHTAKYNCISIAVQMDM